MQKSLLGIISVASAFAMVQPGHAQSVTAPAATQSAPYYSCSRNWYVDQVNGSASNDGTSATSAFKTIGQATWNSALKGGDCINVAPGTYNEFVYLQKGGSSNSLNGYVALVSTQKWGAKIVGPSSNGYSPVSMIANYLVVDGFDVSGGAYGGNCIDGSVNYPITHAHHLIAINNHAHDCGGGGIEFANGDYYIIEGNVSERNASVNQDQASGISIFTGVNLTGTFTATKADAVYYHNIIRGNVSHDNFERWACPTNSPGCHTDGNGIIVDTYSQNAYPFHTLVQNNLVYNNGGFGINITKSNNVVIENNTAYNNYLDTNNNSTWRGELGNLWSSNNLWLNNIANGTTGPGILAENVAIIDSGAMGTTYPNTGVVWSGNVTVGGISVRAPTVLSPNANVQNVDALSGI